MPLTCHLVLDWSIYRLNYCIIAFKQFPIIKINLINVEPTKVLWNMHNMHSININNKSSKLIQKIQCDVWDITKRNQQGPSISIPHAPYLTQERSTSIQSLC